MNFHYKLGTDIGRLKNRLKKERWDKDE